MPCLSSFLSPVKIVNLCVTELFSSALFCFSCCTGYLGYTSGFSLTCMVFFVSVVGDCLSINLKHFYTSYNDNLMWMLE